MKLSALPFSLSASVIFNEYLALTSQLCSTPCHCRTPLCPTTLLRNGIRGWDSPFPMALSTWKICSHVQLSIVARPRCTSPSDRVSLCGLKYKTLKAVLYKLFHPFSTSVFAATELKEVKITPNHIQVLVGDTLYLNCSGQTTYNGRINFTWDFPRIRVSNVSMLQCCTSFLWAAPFKAYDTALPVFRTIVIRRLKKKAKLLWFFLWATP